jgi:ADP-ribosylation factor-like protein 2
VVNRWLAKPIDEVAPTFGFAIHSLAYKHALLSLWDIGGQKSIRLFWKNYFERTDGIVWVVDSSAPERLQLCRHELAQVLQEDRLLSASLLILANKQDVDGAASIEEIKMALGWESLTARCSCLVLPCSALTGAGIESGLAWIVDDVSTHLAYK